MLNEFERRGPDSVWNRALALRMWIETWNAAIEGGIPACFFEAY